MNDTTSEMKDKVAQAAEWMVNAVRELDQRLDQVRKDRDEFERENNVLRGLLSKFQVKCLHCGLDDMSECVYGFPGCPRADDILSAEDTELKHLVDRVRALEAAGNQLMRVMAVDVDSVPYSAWVSMTADARDNWNELTKEKV